jgi:hypothetical protein
MSADTLRVPHFSRLLREVRICLDSLRSAKSGERRHNLPRPLRHFILAQGPLR